VNVDVAVAESEGGGDDAMEEKSAATPAPTPTPVPSMQWDNDLLPKSLVSEPEISRFANEWVRKADSIDDANSSRKPATILLDIMLAISECIKLAPDFPQPYLLLARMLIDGGVPQRKCALQLLERWRSRKEFMRFFGGGGKGGGLERAESELLYQAAYKSSEFAPKVTPVFPAIVQNHVQMVLKMGDVPWKRHGRYLRCFQMYGELTLLNQNYKRLSLLFTELPREIVSEQDVNIVRTYAHILRQFLRQKLYGEKAGKLSGKIADKIYSTLILVVLKLEESGIHSAHLLQYVYEIVKKSRSEEEADESNGDDVPAEVDKKDLTNQMDLESAKSASEPKNSKNPKFGQSLDLADPTGEVIKEVFGWIVEQRWARPHRRKLAKFKTAVLKRINDTHEDD